MLILINVYVKRLLFGPYNITIVNLIAQLFKKQLVLLSQPLLDFSVNFSRVVFVPLIIFGILQANLV